MHAVDVYLVIRRKRQRILSVGRVQVVPADRSESAKMGDAVAQVRAAIGALYGADVARQKEANEFLVQHVSTDAAWSTSLALVADDPSNPPDVQYFGANMMYGKVKGDWGKLPEPHRGPFVQAVSGALTTLLQRPASVLAARRLCMVMAATSVRSGGEATDALVQQALDFAQRGFASGAVEGVTLALEIQAAVADEVGDQRFDVKTALACALVPRIVEVLATSERVLEASVGGNQSSLAGLRSAALHAALAWLRMDSGGGGGCVLSPGQLAQSRRGLVVGALEAMAAEDSAVADAATEFFIAVVQPGAPESSPAEEAAAITGIVQGLLSHGERVLAARDPVATEDLARNVCKVATALCERDANAAAGAAAWDPNAPAAPSPEFLSLTETVLRLTESHERPVMEAAADYFLMLNTVPTSQRHPSAGEPLFRRLASACLRRAELPADFTSWEEADEDRDTFVRFREQILADLLDNCQAQMRSGYLAEVGAALGTASSWQRAEACVFAARVVASPLRRDILEPSTHGGPDADAERSSAMLEQLLGTVGEAGRAASAAGDAGFAAIAGSNVFGSHPVVVESTARMIGAYAPWLGGTVRGHARQETVLMYLLCALRVPAAFRHASHAFRSVCARCAKRLNDANTVASLLDSVQKTLPAAPPKTAESSDGKKDDDDDRSAVIEGIARVIASMPDPTAAADFAKRLAAPVAARAREHMNAAANLAQARLDLLGAEVRLIAAAVRFLEFANLVDVRGVIVEHPAIATLSAAWPTLSALNAEPWRSAPEVVDALCEVYTRCLLCAKTMAAPLLPHLLEALRDAFVAHRHPSCLDALAVAVEVFSAPDPTQPGASRVSDPNTAESFANALLACAQAAHASLSQSPVAEQADVARATFELANKYALFAPDVLLSSPALQPLMGAALVAIGTNERDVVRAALGMLSALIEPGRKAGSTATWQNGRVVVDAWVTSAGGGDALVRALLSAGGNNCPRHLLRPVAQLLHAVRGRYGQITDAWLSSAVTDPSFPSPNDPCDDDARRVFRELATRTGDPLPPQRWSAMVVDFFQICRREADKDALLAHQM